MASALDTRADWALCFAVVAVATVTKLGGAYWAARRSGFDHRESAMIGFMMNTRALMELIVINVGFDLGVISSKMFTMLVVMAIVSTVITTPALRRYQRRAGSVPLAVRSRMAVISSSITSRQSPAMPTSGRRTLPSSAGSMSTWTTLALGANEGP